MTQSLATDPLAVLSSASSTLGQIQCALPELEAKATRSGRVALSSNVTVDLLEVFLRKHAVLQGIRLEVHMGNYDDPMGDVERFQAAGVDHLVILPFFDNLRPGFESQAGHLAEEELQEIEKDFRARYGMMLRSAGAFRTIQLCSLHRFMPSACPGADRVDLVVARFNQALKEEASACSNVRWIEMDEILRRTGQARAFDPRYYFKAKAPYATPFLNALAGRLSLASRGFGSYYGKVLVADCDNTLWGGVVGEDLLEGIKLGPFDYPGNIFWRVQHELRSLEQNGVLLCLCSKNNPDDVKEVLEKHPHAVLADRHIVLQKVNWNDKVSNLKEIASELNLGLDSMVFLDDSSFECESVRSQLPMVRTFQVPPNLSDYPALVQEIKEFFLAGGVSDESRSKTEQYRTRAQALSGESSFASREEYLASLELKVRISRDHLASIPRISELTLKSNQFNVTTRRYSEADIRRFMEGTDATVYSLTVRDRFGDSGLTGVLIMRWNGDTAEVDSFLMSCRVIGRGIEKAVWHHVRNDAMARGCTCIQAEFIPSAKNAQVAEFFDELGLARVGEGEKGGRRYAQPLETFVPANPAWIEVVND